MLILSSIRDEPRNAQQLSEALKLDYTTIRHHLRMMETNRLVLTEGDRYGKLYFVLEVMEAHWSKLEAILEKTRQKEKEKEKGRKTGQ